MVDHYRRLSDYRAPGTSMRVGGEIETWCTRCRAETDHTILAMQGGDPARVMCNSCKSQHNYRAKRTNEKKAGRTRSAKKTARAKREPAPARAWQDASRDKDLKKTIPYDPHQRFEPDQAILHGKFGVGVVTAVKEGDKIEVVFPDAARVLVHGR